MPSSTYTSSFALYLFHDLPDSLRSRRLLLDPPLDKPPSLAATSPASIQKAPGPYAAASGLDSNVVMVLSVLICGLICSLGFNSMIKCVLRCSALAAARSSNNDNNQNLSTGSSASTTNTGIKKKALNSFTTVNYSDDLKLPGLAAECVICLSEFASGDRVRLLPRCNHGFHLRCIDKWLTSHSSCPTCRQNLMETCQKIVGCGQASPSEPLPPPPPSPSPMLQPRESSINMVPVQHEDFMHGYRGNSLSY